MKLLLATAICLLMAPAALAQYAAPAALAYAPSGGSPWQTSQRGRIHPAVVRVVAPGNGSISFGSGTLVYVGANYGLVITNWHVINEATGRISVHFPDGFYSLATVEKVDRDWDLAILATRKPDVEPVKMADRAPRPGEMLTIAGYGSGQYRAATGVCTQYVAPGVTFPFEMVEVAVSARQGDSGGPIFNDRGELAGVLFGEGDGRTSGSYCGRVRWFLASIVPDVSTERQQLASAPLTSVTPRPKNADNLRRPVEIASVGRGMQPADESTRPSLPAHVGAARTVTKVAAPPEPPAPVVASTPAATGPQTQTIGWTDLAGETFGQQLKTVLAVVGVLAIVLHALKWMSTDPGKV